MLSGSEERTTRCSRGLLVDGTIEAHWPEDGAKFRGTGESGREKNGVEAILRLWTASARSPHATCVWLTGTGRISGLYLSRTVFYLRAAKYKLFTSGPVSTGSETRKPF